MALTQPPDVLKLLAHDVRWSLVQSLNGSDYRVQELVKQLDAPMNLISYHLKLLREAGIVAMHKSEADRRDIYYSLEINRLKSLFQEAEQALNLLNEGKRYNASKASPIRVLFVCTHNSARSQMAEALLRELSGGEIAVFSAGGEPSSIHPDAIAAMRAINIDIAKQQPKDWTVFAGQHFDYVISVCDRAREVCPVFPGSQIIHWSFPDPAAIANSEQRKAVFEQTAAALKQRVQYFLDGLRQQNAA